MRPAGLIGLLGACAYSSFLLQWAVGSRLGLVDSYISELSVRGQPGSVLFRALDVGSGVGLLVLAAALARRRRGGRWWSAGWVALAVTALASVVDGIKPLPCAESADPVCRAADRGVLLKQLSELHTITGLVEFGAAITAMVVLSALFPRMPGWRRLRVWGVAAGSVVAGLGLLEIVLVLTSRHWVGLPERGQVLLISLWCGAVAVKLIRRPDRFNQEGG